MLPFGTSASVRSSQPSSYPVRKSLSLPNSKGEPKRGVDLKNLGALVERLLKFPQPFRFRFRWGGTTCLQLLGLKHKFSKSNRKMSCKTTFKSCETQIDGVEFSQKLFWALFIQKETWHRQRLRSVNLGQQRFRALQYHDARFPQDPPSQKLEEASQLTEN